MRTTDLPPPAATTAGHPDRATVAALLLSGLLLLCFSFAGLPSAHAACDPPRCFDVVVPVPSGIAVPDSTVRVLLPVDYGTTTKRYPVLYLLHGAGDTYATWTENTDVEEFSAQFPLIIVMPDGGHDANAGFYSDWVDGSRQWETFHTQVLRTYVERNFRTLTSRRHRALAGLSMGGFGAMSYAGRHPDLYGAAASFSGAVDILYPTPAGDVLFFSGTVGSGIWGDPVTDEATWRAHNPPDLVGKLRSTALFLATGDGTMGGPAGDIPVPAAYAIEQVVDQMTLSFARALDSAGVPYAKDFYKGGYHGWPYWERELHWSLPQIVSLIGPAVTPCAPRLSNPGATAAGSFVPSSCRLSRRG